MEEAIGAEEGVEVGLRQTEAQPPRPPLPDPMPDSAGEAVAEAIREEALLQDLREAAVDLLVDSTTAEADEVAEGRAGEAPRKSSLATGLLDRTTV